MSQESSSNLIAVLPCSNYQIVIQFWPNYQKLAELAHLNVVACSSSMAGISDGFSYPLREHSASFSFGWWNCHETSVPLIGKNSCCGQILNLVLFFIFRPNTGLGVRQLRPLDVVQIDPFHHGLQGSFGKLIE